MKTSREERKEFALKCMEELGIYKPYIWGFKSDNDICFFERFGGHWASQEEWLLKKAEEIEKKYNLTVYAITHEVFEFGDCYSFLFVPNEKEHWEYVIEKVSSNSYNVFAYVWNVDDELCSEFGTVAIQSYGSGIRRIA